jgi:hypothetical protein
MTKNSMTELTPSVEHTLEAPTFTTVDGKPLQKTRKRKRPPLTENGRSGQARPRQTARERPLSQPIGPSEPLLQPSSIKPEETSYVGLDRTFKANLARLTHGLTPAGLARAYFDWLTHLMLAPGKQLQLAEKAVRKATFTRRMLRRTPRHRLVSTPCRRIVASMTKAGVHGRTI